MIESKLKYELEWDQDYFSIGFLNMSGVVSFDDNLILNGQDWNDNVLRTSSFVYSDENGNSPESVSITLNSDSDLSYRGVEIDYLRVLFKPEDECYKGDVSHDGVVDVIDVVNVVNFIFEISNPVYYEQCTSDLNNDDVIDVMDVVMVVNLIFGIDN